jgi:hypothetical protein
LTEDRLAEALRAQKATLERLGHVLVEHGWVDQESLAHQLVLQITDTVLDLFRWKDGEYDFRPEPVDWDRAYIDPLPIENLLIEGARMVDEWPIIERFISSRSLVLRTTPSAADLLTMSPDAQEARGSVYEQDIDFGFISAHPLAGKAPKTHFTEQERSVLRWIDGRRNAGDIAEVSGLGSFACFQTLAHLIKDGFLEAVPVLPEDKALRASGRVLAVSARVLNGFILALAALGIGSGIQETVRALFPGQHLLPATSPIASAGALSAMTGLDRLRRSVSETRLDRIEEGLVVQFLDQGAWPEALTELAGWDLVPRRFVEDPWGNPYRFQLRPWGYRLSESPAAGWTALVRERRFRALERSVADNAPEAAGPAAP